ncbi:MAG: metallophosphoesterase [Treponema sp.]|jgi:predicted phosphodiesterase|nr:metallophosphoesterase [Treponema sp.]
MGTIKTKPVKTALLLCVLGLGLSGCAPTLIPRFSNDYDSRFSWRNEFHFLRPADRNPTAAGDYSFIVVSDTHIEDAASAGQFAALGGKLKPSDKFIVITGDVTDDGTREQVQLFIDTAGTFSIPCYPVMGNHDLWTGKGMPWRELIGSTIYRVNAPGVTLLILDAANASLGYEQLEWLTGELRSAEKTAFVFMHNNLFIDSSPPDIEQFTDIRERARIMWTLKNRCTALFSGHLHKRLERTAGGVSYLTLENYGQGVFCRVHITSSGVRWEFLRMF